MNQVRPVERAMRTTLLLVALAALVVGCSKPEVKTTSNSNAPHELTDQEKLDAIRNATEREVDKVKESDYVIAAPGTKGWKPTNANFEQVGELMDKRLAEAKNVKVQAKLTYNDPTVGKMVFSPKIEIADANTFDVEYVLPDEREAQIWVRGDGSRRAKNVDAVWSELPGAGKSGKAMGEKEVLEFPRRFPELMFGRLTESIDVWGPLFKAWKDGVGGYTVTFEEQSFTVEGKQRIQYRILAKTTTGGPTEVEVTIDQKALRPVAVRSIGTLKNGEKYKMLWTGGWMVGGTLDKNAFHLPKVLPKQITGEGA